MTRTGTTRDDSGGPSSSDLADALRGQIHRGELGPGDRLLPERELAASLGVPRLRLRDALAELEHEGYLVARRGAGGGRFVTELRRPFRSWAARMRDRLDELDDMVDFRLAVECQTVRFAAERRSRSDLTAMRRTLATLERAGSPRDYRLADVAFHGALCVASRSARLAAAVERARGELFEPADELWREGLADSLADHERIVAAIEDRDASGAAAAMAGHIERTRHELRALLQRDR